MKKLETSKDYHLNPAIGSTLLKKITSKTLFHALNEEIEQTSAMVLGSAFHCSILEPEKFNSEYVTVPEGTDKRTKAGKDIWAEIEASGKTVLRNEEMANIIGMKTSILSHPIAKKMLQGGEAEYSYYSKDTETGIETKCRPDYKNGGTLIDIKTAQDASYEGFSRAIVNLGYLVQAAYYLDVFNASEGENYKDFHFIVVENKAPFAVAIYRLDEAQIEFGRKQYKKALKKYSDFLALDLKKVPMSFGYAMDIVDIQIPYYMLDKIENS